MKSKLILFVVSLFFVACSNDDIDLVNYGIVDKNPNVKEPEIVSLNVEGTRANGSDENIQGQALKFKDYTHYQQWVYKMEELTPAQRDSVNRKLGFVSIDSLLITADTELDSIGMVANSEEEFRKMYAEYVAKYRSCFVFNTDDPEDLSAYIPASDNENIDRYLYGRIMKVVIKGKVINSPFYDKMNSIDKLIYGNASNNYKSFAQTMRRLPSENTWPINNMIKIVGHKKTIFSARLNGDDVIFHLGAQKKMWYGWKRDNDREFYFTMEDFCGINEPVYANGELRPTHFVADLDTHVDYYHFWGMKNGDRDFRMGTKRPLPSACSTDHEPITGKIFIWTDMTIDHDENGNVIYVKMGTFTSTSPSMTKDKSYPCKVSL